jgi:hypothetical protein
MAHNVPGVPGVMNRTRDSPAVRRRYWRLFHFRARRIYAQARNQPITQQQKKQMEVKHYGIF